MSGAGINPLARGWRRLHNRLARMRYFRGHGVHSPFVYTLIREVFMQRKLLAGDHRLYEVLLAHGIAKQTALQLQNVATHCRYTHFGLNCAEGEFCLLLPTLSPTECARLIARASEEGKTLAILAPYQGRERWAMCQQAVAQHRSTSVDKRTYLLLFNNYLPKQEFRL